MHSKTLKDLGRLQNAVEVESKGLVVRWIGISNFSLHHRPGFFF